MYLEPETLRAIHSFANRIKDRHRLSKCDCTFAVIRGILPGADAINVARIVFVLRNAG